MYEYGVEYGIIQDGEIPEVQLRGDITWSPLTCKGWASQINASLQCFPYFIHQDACLEFLWRDFVLDLMFRGCCKLGCSNYERPKPTAVWWGVCLRLRSGRYSEWYANVPFYISPNIMLTCPISLPGAAALPDWPHGCSSQSSTLLFAQLLYCMLHVARQLPEVMK